MIAIVSPTRSSSGFMPICLYAYVLGYRSGCVKVHRKDLCDTRRAQQHDDDDGATCTVARSSQKVIKAALATLSVAVL